MTKKKTAPKKTGKKTAKKATGSTGGSTTVRAAKKASPSPRPRSTTPGRKKKPLPQSGVAPSDRRSILMISSELAPFAKTGGLADAVASLSVALREMGHDVRIVMPKYAGIDFSGRTQKVALESMGVWMGTKEEWCRVITTTGYGDVPVYLVEFENYFERSGLYHGPFMDDYLDNPKRFAFLARAGLQVALDTGFSPGIIHAHDWQAALAPAYLKTWFWDNPQLGKAASVLTIHNVAYQGVYPRDSYPYIGLGERNFAPEIFEDHGRMNFLKGGIHFADVINTVSPTHAREMTTPFGGFGLAPFLTLRGDDFTGILNGVDYTLWSPENDSLLPARYSRGDLYGKHVCKRKLQEKLHLAVDDQVAVIGTVGRFVSQKGYQLLAQSIEKMLRTMHVQFVVVGSGDGELEKFFGGLPQRFPGRVGSFIGFNNPLAHLVEAGADFFVMPSLYEPCGLNQMYSLRYGTLPIVRATGGLDDTVENYNEQTGEGTGFKFDIPTPGALYDTVGWAISTFYDRPHHMSRLIDNAMSRCFSWDDSAQKYLAFYRKALSNKHRYDKQFV